MTLPHTGIRSGRFEITLSAPGKTIGLSSILVGLSGSNQLAGLRCSASAQPLQDASRVMHMKLKPQTRLEFLAFPGFTCTAAVCVRFLYRGLVRTLSTRPHWLGAAENITVSAVFFSSAHICQRKRRIITTSVVSMGFPTRFLFTKRLIPTSLSHLVADLMTRLVPVTFSFGRPLGTLGGR